MKILANDGLAASAQEKLEKAGHEVIQTKVAQDQLIDYINKNDIGAILVRSATQVRKDIIDACDSLKIIGRAGVGMDNIDVEYARNKGVKVINTPAASSASVAELVFAHLYGGVRFLHDANRNMPLEGEKNFKKLKKSYAKGRELRGKTLGIIGLGRIGTEVAKIALGVGMKVISADHEIAIADVELTFHDGQTITLQVEKMKKAKVLAQSDFITLHVPAQDGYVLGKDDFTQMKDGVGIVNAARGGVVDEKALTDAIESGKVSFAALDVFENEPEPPVQLLMNEKLSLSPHIGAATVEAQDRIGLELADQIIDIAGKS